MDFLDSTIAHYGAGIVFAVTLIARLGAPVPAAPLLVMAGALGARDARELGLTVVAAAVASLAGDGTWFVAGRHYGYRVLRMLCRISLSPDTCVRKSSELLGKWGGASLVAAKFLPGISAVAAPMAGALGMRVRRFLAFQALGSLLWALTFVMLGFAFHKDVAALLDVISEIGIDALGLVALVVVVYTLLSYLKRRLAMRVSIPTISPTELAERLLGDEKPMLVDLRSVLMEDAVLRPIPGAVPVEISKLQGWAREKSRAEEIVVYCDCPNDATAVGASRLLFGEGFSNVRVLKGGIDAWRKDTGAEDATERGEVSSVGRFATTHHAE